MEKGITKEALEIWNSDASVPKMLNKKVVREELKKDFAQVPDLSVDFLDVVIYSIMKYISKRVKEVHGDGRITQEKIRDIILLDDFININYGNINIVNESVDISEERIANKVLTKLALANIQNRKVNKEDVDYKELINELGD